VDKEKLAISEKIDLPKQKAENRERSVSSELLELQKEEEKEKTEERINEIRQKLSSDPSDLSFCLIPSYLSQNEGKMHISFNMNIIEGFFTDQGLSKEQISEFKIEFRKLLWSNKTTRSIASILPGRFREIFIRIESLKGDTLKVFTNNLESIYDSEDRELILRDTIHHLFHFVQRKKGVSGIKHFFTRLPIIHQLSGYEKEARDFARKTNLGNRSWSELVQFSNLAKRDRSKLKIEV
jgi:hypothetical protein